jgi:hypothetical protein
MHHERDVSAMVVSTDPLIVYSTRSIGAPLGIASLKPDHFRGRKALHLLALDATIETDDRANKVARDLQIAAGELPESNFVVLTNTGFESYLLAEIGVSAMPCNRATFIDENTFAPVDGPAQFDAIYNARLTPAKRHELARDLANLALLYDRDRPDEPNRYDDVRAALPRATFVNHQEGRGAYRHLSSAECAKHINRARVGLCLSAGNGPTLAAMEYMLTGLPIVSTYSRGGRERYMLPPFCRMVDDNPAAVADAVDMYVRKPIPKNVIRAHALHTLRFERHNFMIAINKLANEFFGIPTLFDSFAPFETGLASRRTIDEALAPLARAAS